MNIRNEDPWKQRVQLNLLSEKKSTTMTSVNGVMGERAHRFEYLGRHEHVEIDECNRKSSTRKARLWENISKVSWALEEND